MILLSIHNMKDIFIDNCCSPWFNNPLGPDIKKLILWLRNGNSSTPTLRTTLCVSKKLINEYKASNQGCQVQSSIPILIDLLLREGRLNNIEEKAIQKLKSRAFKNVNLVSNKKDHHHIALVLLSFRRIALTTDKKLTTDLSKFPKYRIQVEKKIAKLNYQ